MDNRLQFPPTEVDWSVVGATGQAHDTYPAPGQPTTEHQLTGKEFALGSLVDQNYHRLIDVVLVKCSKCGSTSNKRLRDVIKCCRNSKRYYVCRTCSSREIANRADVRIKMARTKLTRRHIYAEKLKKLWTDPVYRSKMSDICKRVANTEEGRRQRSIQSRNAWRDINYRNKAIELGKLYYKSPDYTSEIRKKLSEATTRNWQNPELRKRYLVGAKLARKVSLTNNISSLNKKVSEILSVLSVQYEAEYSLGPYHFDFFVPSKNVLIECQGEYWHSLKENILRDKQKATYVLEYFPHLKLRYLLEIEFYNSEALNSKICDILSINNKLIDFDFTNITIREIEYSIASEFLGMWHYLHNLKSNSIKYGVYLNNELIGVCTFSQPRNKIDGVIELDRFCIHPSRHKQNFASFIISRCVKMLPPNYHTIISFADATHNHIGTIYKALNWKMSDDKVKPDYWYIDDRKWVCHKRTIYERAIKLGMTEADYAIKNNLLKCFGKEKSKFYYERSNNG